MLCNEGEEPPSSRRHELRGILGRAPDPGGSHDLLSVLRDQEDPDTRWIAAVLCADADLSRRQLRHLLPGLGLVESPHFSIRLSVRAANGLSRAGAERLATLAGMSPAELLELPDVGIKTAEEVLRAVVGEWAASYLGSVEGGYVAVGEPEEGTGTRADAGAERDRLRDLAEAFASLEGVMGFAAFRRRWLDPDRPSQSAVGEELGVSGARVSQNERGVRALLAEKVRDSDWPIAAAVGRLKRWLGPVALVNELEAALAEIDPTHRVVSADLPHRRSLLLQLGGYRPSGAWVIEPDIEQLTRAMLRGLTEDGPVELDFVGRQLARLGIRDVLHMPWIISQSGFQIADGRILRSD